MNVEENILYFQLHGLCFTLPGENNTVILVSRKKHRHIFLEYILQGSRVPVLLSNKGMQIMLTVINSILF